MKRRPLLRLAAFGSLIFTMTFIACGGEDDGGTSSSGKSSSSQCDSTHSCLNGACECTTSGKEGTACCDPNDCGSDADNCTDKCEVCN
jgi:hypothetical protein